MEESATYQAILAKGRAAGLQEGRTEGALETARTILLHLGGKRFGPPNASTQAAIDAITSPEKLEQLTERILDVESWSELLAAA
ncbi:MAG TPA: hypothetical protein VFB38_00030 [Chthonomonadaceae bacterium]|nr:hypothetical protein [Chthonomonadaceae bacterium]